ncbi:MAG: hypothetical protein HFJ60_04400 [Clostridia bacterium]|nr:hypothetical protein [Clostridia bacterium]
MEEEDKRNQELLIVGKAFLHTGITKIEDLIQNYINTSEQYHDSYSVVLLKKIKEDIEKYRDIENEKTNELLKTKEPSFYIYTGKIIKVFDKTTQCGFCVKKDYINDKLVEIQGIRLDFNNSQIVDIDEEQCRQVEEIYCESNNKLYQLSIKEFSNRDYGKLLYENIRNSFSVLKKDEVLER